MTQVSTLGKLAVVTAGILGIATACGSTSPAASSSSSSSSSAKIGGSVTLWAEWTAQEQQDFQAALAPFEADTGITVNYQGKGNNMDTALTAAVAGGSPPDVALVPDPGTLDALAKQNAIKPLTSILGSLTSNFGAAWNTLASYNGTQYGVWFKGANKNTIWYNPALFTAAGITSPPTTWEQLLTDAAQLKAAGIDALLAVHRRRLAGGRHVAEHLSQDCRRSRLQQAGDTRHQVDRSDGHDSVHDHGPARRQHLVSARWAVRARCPTPIPHASTRCSPSHRPSRQAAMVIEADFVVSEITGNSANYTPGTTGAGGAACTADPAKTPCYNFFAFPAPVSRQRQQHGNPGRRRRGDDAPFDAASDRADQVPRRSRAAARSGHISVGSRRRTTRWRRAPIPDPVSQADAKALVNASSFVFSLDDLQGSWEPKLWADLLQFLQNPSAFQRLDDRGDDGFAGDGCSGPLTLVTSRNHGRPGSSLQSRAGRRRRVAVGLSAGPTGTSPRRRSPRSCARPR